MNARIFTDVNASSATGVAANEPAHHLGEGVNTGDRLPSPYLLGIALSGSAVACLLIRLVIG